jgi:hypothetical protein
MDNLQNFILTHEWLAQLILFFVIWDSSWKAIALWKAARNNDVVWFVFIAVLNTLGILPIIYIILSKKMYEN